MSRFEPVGQFVYEKGDRIGCTPDEAAIKLARKLNAYQMRIERLKAKLHDNDNCPHFVVLGRLEAENARLKAEVERLTKGHSTDFVRAEMYRHLLDENAKLKEEVMRMRNDDYKEGDILQKCCEHQKNRIARLKAEVERLTKAVMHSPAAQLKLKELEGKITYKEINPKGGQP